LFDANTESYATTDEGVLSRPFSSRNSSTGSFVRVNGKIRAREVRVVGADGKQFGVLPLNEALVLARQHGVDLVEIAPGATPPVCRLVDYGKFRYEQSKRDKESKKHQHASTVKEIQLSPRIDPHDLSIKVAHAVDFLCEDMKVKVALRFRGREMAHKEIGFQVVNTFVSEIAAYGHPDFEPKLIGRGINVMVSPLPRNKRAKSPRQTEGGHAPVLANNHPAPASSKPETPKVPVLSEPQPGGFVNNPFASIEAKSKA
jgi:translation initiation factor IF-3